MPSSEVERSGLGIRAAQLGLLINVVLVVVKLIAGIVGHTYALIADAAESTTDIFASIVVWAGLSIAAQPADREHPYGHGKAEPLAAVAVSMLLVGAAFGIAFAAIREIQHPHHIPAPFTLWVAGGVILVKWWLARRVSAVSDAVGSTAVRADAWHHVSDAISSSAAFIGIGIALWVHQPGWEQADNWAALVASLLILVNGVHMLRPAMDDLMDRMPTAETVDPIERAARDTLGVCSIEHLKVRKIGLGYHVDLHVQADPTMSLYESHELSGRVKAAIRSASPNVSDVLVHMEPFTRRAIGEHA